MTILISRNFINIEKFKTGPNNLWHVSIHNYITPQLKPSFNSKHFLAANKNFPISLENQKNHIQIIESHY